MKGTNHTQTRQKLNMNSGLWYVYQKWRSQTPWLVSNRPIIHTVDCQSHLQVGLLLCRIFEVCESTQLWFRGYFRLCSNVPCCRWKNTHWLQEEGEHAICGEQGVAGALKQAERSMPSLVQYVDCNIPVLVSASSESTFKKGYAGMRRRYEP